MWQQLLLFLTAVWLQTVSAYLPYDLPGGPKAASFDVRRKMGREKDHQDPTSDLVIGQGPLHRNNGDDTNKPIAVIPEGGARRVPLGNGSGVVSRTSDSAVAAALPGSIDPMTSWKAALAKLKSGRRDSMARLNEVYVSCGKKQNDSAVKACLASDQVHLVKARLRSFNETVKLVEAMEPEARSISKELKGAAEEMKTRMLQEGEAKVILKSEAYSDREARRQMSEAAAIDHKEELREDVLRGYVKDMKADKHSADDANTYSLLTHEEFHVRLNGIVKGITVGDQLAKAIFDRTGSILETARLREANALRMSMRAEELINTTNSWTKIQQERHQHLRPPEQVNNETNGHLEELRKLDEEASSLHGIGESSLDGFGAQRRPNETIRNDSFVKKPNFRRLKDQDKSGSVQKLHLLDLAAGGKPPTAKASLTPEALAGLGSDELTEKAQKMASGALNNGDGAQASNQDIQQMLKGNVEDDTSSGSSGPAEFTDDAFEDDDEQIGIRSSKDGYKQLDMEDVGSVETADPETSDSAGNGDIHSQAETSADDDTQDPTAPVKKEVPILPEDPDDTPAPPANPGTTPAVQADIAGSTPDAEKSIIDKSIDDAQVAMTSSAVTSPPTIIHFEDLPTNIDTGNSVPDEAGNSDEDLVEDDSPSLKGPPSFRGLYRREQTPASQHFMRTALGRENFGFQAISRTLGVRVKESAEDEEEGPTEEGQAPQSSGFGTEVKDIAFQHRVPGSDMPTEPDPGQILRTLESNVEKHKARHKVDSTGVFEINYDN